MRILSICETAMGGVGIYQNYLGGLADRDLNLHFLAPEQHLGFLDRSLEVTTFQRKSRGPGAVLQLLRKFVALRRQLRPDLYFFHSTFSLTALTLLRAMGDRTPAVYFPHGWAVSNYHPHTLKSRAVRMIEGRLSRLADCVVNVSRHEQDLASGLGYGGTMTVIENAVPDCGPQGERTDPQPPDKLPGMLDLLFVGRFDRQKGLDLLLPAFERAARRRPDLRLHVIGGEVRGDSAPRSLPPNVNLVGWVDRAQLDRWYRFADAVVVPSRWEGLPLVIPEAFRNGAPVLCAESSGMPDLLTRNVTGDHFPLSVQAIEAALTELDGDRLREMRPACRAHYERRFSMSRWQSQMIDLISKFDSGKGAT